MLQRGSWYTVANCISHEESRVSMNAEGNEMVERLVQRGVILLGGQEVHIHKLISAYSGLGKRKTEYFLEVNKTEG